MKKDERALTIKVLWPSGRTREILQGHAMYTLKQKQHEVTKKQTSEIFGRSKRLRLTAFRLQKLAGSCRNGIISCLQSNLNIIIFEKHHLFLGEPGSQVVPSSPNRQVKTAPRWDKEKDTERLKDSERLNQAAGVHMDIWGPFG